MTIGKERRAKTSAVETLIKNETKFLKSLMKSELQAVLQ